MRFTFLAYLFLLVAHVFAQPTLTGTNSNPVIGDIFVVKNTNYISPGPGGPNQTWNLAAMSATSTTTYTVFPNTSSSFGNSFPGSIDITQNTQGAAFYYADTARFSFAGSGYNNGYINVTQSSDREDFLRYPFSYNSVFTDSFYHSTYSSGPYPPGTSDFTYGTITDTADGYGTLILPNGTFSNVLRVHYIENYFDSSLYSASSAIINDVYEWFLPGNHWPIAGVQSTMYNGNGPYLSGWYLNNIFNGVESYPLQPGIVLYPVPASSIVTLKITGSPVLIRLFDLMGRNLEVPITFVEPGKYLLDTRGLPGGIYSLNLLFADRSPATCKLLVDH